jgi:hypothetical protein
MTPVLFLSWRRPVAAELAKLLSIHQGSSDQMFGTKRLPPKLPPSGCTTGGKTPPVGARLDVDTIWVLGSVAPLRQMQSSIPRMPPYLHARQLAVSGTSLGDGQLGRLEAACPLLRRRRRRSRRSTQ